MRFKRLYVKGVVGSGSVPPPATVTRILGCYFEAYNNGSPYVITDVPMSFNVIYLFNARPNASNNGSFFWTDWGVTSTQVQTCRTRGQRVILSVGGSGFGFDFNTRAKSDKFISSFQVMATSFGGIDGVDFNNYEGISITTSEMTYIGNQLRTIYGSKFLRTSPPQPNSTIDRAMLSAMAAGGALDFAGGQYYDWTGFCDPGFITTRTGDWVSAIGQAKTMIGMGGGYAGGCSLAVSVQEYSASHALYPNLGGAFCWSAATNIADGNHWGSTMNLMVNPTF